jgi:nitrate reductase gamma subunit
MDWFSYLTSGIGVYVALVVFTGGMAWRTWQWSHTPKSPVRLALYPKPKTGAGRFGKLLTDTFIAPQSAKIAPRMWAFAMLFHVAALAAFVGHLRLVHLFDPIEAAIGVDNMNAFAGLAGGVAGIAMLVAVVYWLSRRTFGPYKALSVPEDYILLVLVLLVVLMGDHMRFVGEPLHADVFKQWFDSLVRFAPSFPAALATSTEKWALDFHMLFVDLLLIYFPFSKLTHAIGAFATNLVRSGE